MVRAIAKTQRTLVHRRQKPACIEGRTVRPQIEPNHSAVMKPRRTMAAPKARSNVPRFRKLRWTTKGDNVNGKHCPGWARIAFQPEGTGAQDCIRCRAKLLVGCGPYLEPPRKYRSAEVPAKSVVAVDTVRKRERSGFPELKRFFALSS